MLAVIDEFTPRCPEIVVARGYRPPAPETTLPQHLTLS
jgi:hypothetical protein